ncbi:hypothetical protein LIER_09562 [Lithospermum erythrorhizon]|uniref:F-box domain-containing protein n=1 Tax=Lithospermum erythrorhizon TaxID=34254 RepID=A0AAV3PIE7_LITER
MEGNSCNSPTSISQLPDDCLCLIFQFLDCYEDRESFGLTCHRWLKIQNSGRVSLQFECSFTYLGISSLSQTPISIGSFHLNRMLNRFKQLQSLSLSGCVELSDSDLMGLQSYGPSLQCLYLDCCFGVTDNGIGFIARGCPNLTIVGLYRCNVTDVGLHMLSSACMGLRDVNLAHCSLISDNGIKAISRSCRQLRAIRISYCRNISGVGFQGCSPTLSYLEADSCKLESEGILGIASGGGLEYLSLFDLNWWLTGNVLTTIGSGLVTKLKVLNLRCCRTIDDDSITAIAEGCPLLQEWNLALCHEVRLAGWKSIGLNCRNMKKLHVNRCRNLCDRGVKALREGCRQLSVLYISGCRQITIVSMEMFKITRGNVAIVEEEIMCIAPDWAFKL